MKVELAIIEGNSLEEIMDSREFKDFTQHCLNYGQQILAEAKKDLTPEEQTDVDTWWNGKSVYGPVTQKTSSACLWICSMGLG
jgi:hypothetical protein